VSRRHERKDFAIDHTAQASGRRAVCGHHNYFDGTRIDNRDICYFGVRGETVVQGEHA